MKTKFLYGCIGMLLVALISLSAYIATLQRGSDTKLFEEYNQTEDSRQLWGTTDAIPDAETAKRIADIILEAHSMINNNSAVVISGYDVKIVHDDVSNEWHVTYTPIQPDEGVILGGTLGCHIRRDNGAITELYAIP